MEGIDGASSCSPFKREISFLRGLEVTSYPSSTIGETIGVAIEGWNGDHVSYSESVGLRLDMWRETFWTLDQFTVDPYRGTLFHRVCQRRRENCCGMMHEV